MSLGCPKFRFIDERLTPTMVGTSSAACQPVGFIPFARFSSWSSSKFNDVGPM